MSASRRNWVYRGGIALFALLAAVLVFSSEDGASPVETTVARELTTTEGLLELIERESSEYLLVDVRTAGEYAAGFIPTAINIPHQNIVEGLPEGAKDRLIILYCRTGSRSSRAEQWLERAGYTNVVDFGGILSWRGPIAYPNRGG